MTATPIRTFDAVLPHGITLACRAAGDPGATRRVLLLHGFPEGAFAWDEVLAALAPLAYTVAPDQRGYGRSSAPAGVEAYRPRHLVGDLVALIGQLGAPLDLLVAHDWGGSLAWNLAALAPQLVKRLVIVNAPHAGALLRGLRDDPAQQAASAYMHELVHPAAATRLAADGFAALFAKFSRFGGDGAGGGWLTDAWRARYVAHWSLGLDGALNWYRASPLRPPVGPGDAALQAVTLPDSVLAVNVPTTVLWGEADTALLPGLLDGLDQWVPDLQVYRHPAASHWIVHEQPAWVIDHLKALLAAD